MRRCSEGAFGQPHAAGTGGAHDRADDQAHAPGGDRWGEGIKQRLMLFSTVAALEAQRVIDLHRRIDVAATAVGVGRSLK